MYQLDEIMYGCPVEALSNILGKKWIAIIIWEIKDRQFRFGELQRAVDGCSKKMLTQQLDILMEHGIVANDKTTINNVTESIYYLTNSGLNLLPIMKSMIEWSDQYLSCGEMI